MYKKLLSTAVGILVALSGWTTVLAQDDEDKAPYVVPVDTFTCNYNEGKGAADLQKAIDDWNAWMDDQGVDSYGAMTMTPYYFGPDSFDVGWLGFWSSQEAMGRGIDNYLANGGAAAQGFAETLSCDTHGNWASIEVKSPPEGAPDNFVIMFSDCSRKNDTTYDDLFAKLDDAVAYMTENQYGNGMWMMWPVLGGGGEDEYEFKSVTSYASYTDFGKAYQHRANGGGRQALNEIMGNSMVCDTRRVYNATMVRTVEMDNE